MCSSKQYKQWEWESKTTRINFCIPWYHNKCIVSLSNQSNTKEEDLQKQQFLCDNLSVDSCSQNCLRWICVLSHKACFIFNHCFHFCYAFFCFDLIWFHCMRAGIRQKVDVPSELSLLTSPLESVEHRDEDSACSHQDIAHVDSDNDKDSDSGSGRYCVNEGRHLWYGIWNIYDSACLLQKCPLLYCGRQQK